MVSFILFCKIQLMPHRQSSIIVYCLFCVVWDLPRVWYWSEILLKVSIGLFDSQLSLSIKTVPFAKSHILRVKGWEGEEKTSWGYIWILIREGWLWPHPSMSTQMNWYGFRGPSCLTLSDETTDLTERGRQGADWNARSKKREFVSPPDRLNLKSGHRKRQKQEEVDIFLLCSFERLCRRWWRK